MDIRITCGAGRDRIEASLASGTRIAFETPCKGPIPHDAVHLFVETRFGIRRGFWGLVGEGMTPDRIQGLARAGGHPSASRASPPDLALHPILQAERLVEVFEADLWGGGEGAEADLLALAAVACARAHVALPPVPEGAVSAVREDLRAFAEAWIALPRGDAITLEWKG
jgi:hypothetical protein